MRLACITLGLTLAASASAQKLDLNLGAIAAHASGKSEVDLDGEALAAARKTAGKLPAQLANIKELHVRSYEFAQAGAYEDKGLDSIRKQVASGSGWSRIVSVQAKTDKKVEVYLYQPGGGAVGGLLVLAGEPKELNVIHIIGEISPDKLAELVHSNIQYDLKPLTASAQR